VANQGVGALSTVHATDQYGGNGMGKFKLAPDTFDTKFPEQMDVPEALKTLPTMQCVGNVRKLLRAAAQPGSMTAKHFAQNISRIKESVRGSSLLTRCRAACKWMRW